MYKMNLNDPSAYRTATELEVISELLDLRGARILELGCGNAQMTRQLADKLAPFHITATEVDRIQFEKNLGIVEQPNISFRFGGAESIDDSDGTYDLVFMFKSLHHVPGDLLDQSLHEIHRVLKPGGFAYFSEPVYWGEFNEVMRLIHDEKRVREMAFSSLKEAVDSGLFELEKEVFFQVPGSYETWEIFEDRFIKITHTKLDIDTARYAQIRQAFLNHMTPTGVHFLKPHRVDLLRKQA